jgi:putative membrane protein
MADAHAVPGANRFEVRVTADSHFAWLRTRLSVERTMMAFQRTAIALIGFGFAIVQFLARLQDIPGVKPAYIPHAPEYLGLALIGCGVLALIISVWYYEWTVRYMWSGTFAPLAGMTAKEMPSPAVTVSILLTAIGLFAFFAVLLRLF